jgi:hypothetical protein
MGKNEKTLPFSVTFPDNFIRCTKESLLACDYLVPEGYKQSGATWW